MTIPKTPEDGDTFTVPFLPTEQQWNGLARDIVMWWSMKFPTGKNLYSHLRALGIVAPIWLLEEIPNTDKVPPKGTVATAIYKAMLHGMIAWTGRPKSAPEDFTAQSDVLKGSEESAVEILTRHCIRLHPDPSMITQEMADGLRDYLGKLIGEGINPETIWITIYNKLVEGKKTTTGHWRKKPVVVEAFQLATSGATWFPDWFPRPNPSDVSEDGIIIHTLEGDHLARPGDWIIKGVKGEFYPCKPEIFEATYEAAE